MSRVRDDNSDNRRIREMNEASLRRKVDNEKKSSDGRVQRSFNEVIKDKTRKKEADKASKQEATEKKADDNESVLDRIRKQGPRSKLAQERRAALNRRLQGQARKKAAGDAQEASRAENARAEELTTKTEGELEHVEMELGRDDELEQVRGEEKQAEVQQAQEGTGGPVERADPDGRQKQNQQQGGRQQDRSNEAASVQGARRAQRVVIPQEVLRRLVSAIYKAVSADGRTSMRITLKGGKLEGVQVQINAEGGKVSCEFSNCSKEIKGMLQKGKRALASGLARRGLKLEGLTVN